MARPFVTLGKSALLAIPLLGCALAVPVQAGTLTYKVDFGTEGSPVGEGFTAAELPTLKATPGYDLQIPDETGKNPIHLQFDCDIGGYSLGNKDKPLTTDGIYTFGSNGKDPTNIPFCFSGLPPKAKASLYAVRAWNGAGRGAFLSLGDSGMIDIAGSPDEDTPDPKTQADFITVAEDRPVGADGKISGIFSNSDGNTTRAEGQWGAMILVVKTP